MTIARFILGMILVVLAIEDIKNQKISLIVAGVTAILGVFVRILSGNLNFPDMFGGVAIGAALLFLAFISRGSVGYGDGFIVCTIGIMLGFRENAAVLLGGCLICSLFSLVLLLLGKAKGKSSVPFVPFVTLSYWAVICLRI